MSTDSFKLWDSLDNKFNHDNFADIEQIHSEFKELTEANSPTIKNLLLTFYDDDEQVESFLGHATNNVIKKLLYWIYDMDYTKISAFVEGFIDCFVEFGYEE